MEGVMLEKVAPAPASSFEGPFFFQTKVLRIVSILERIQKDTIRLGTIGVVAG